MKPRPVDRSWFIVRRWQEYAGEGRANLLRVLALLMLYSVQWYQFATVDVGSEASRVFHRQVTLIVVAWLFVCLAVLLCLQRKIFPPVVKYLSTATDVTLLTLLAHFAGGPGSPIVQAYYLIIALAALRFSVGLVWFSALACMSGYGILTGLRDEVWFDANHATPVIQQLVTLVSLALAGIIAGQVVRRVQGLAMEFAERAQRAGGSR